MSLGSYVRIATRLLPATHNKYCGSIPGRNKSYLFSILAPYLMDVGGCFLVGKAARVKLTIHLHPSVEEKNGWRYTSSPPYALTAIT
jgi:hypothetical protein